MHRDVGVIHQEINTLDGIVVPAHILAHQKPSTSAFITSLPANTAYIVDPATYRFQNARDRHLNAADELRASTAKLCAEYHPDLTALVSDHGLLRPELLPAPRELTENVIAFQLGAVADGTRRSAARKYLERYGRSSVRAPRAVLPPYFRFDAPGDSWYRYSLECAEVARQMSDGGPAVAPVIAAPWSAFREAPLLEILQDYREFDQLILWIDEFHEQFARPEQISAVRRAIIRLREHIDRVEALYGGYLLLMTAHDGLAGIGHGINYAQHKSFQITGPGQGGISERYYIPGLRHFRSLSQTDLILHRFPELICQCSVCAETLGGDPDRIVQFFDDPELLRRHFLNARREEADRMLDSSRGREAEELRGIHNTYHDAIRALPNPDAVVSGANMQGLDFLLSWADGIEADVA
jgi:hypothetical protein